MSRFLALVKTLFRAMSQLHKDLPPWLKYAALVVLVAAGAGFLIWKWGFRKQIDAAKIARLPVVGIDSLRFLPDGKLASMRSTPSGFVTVFIWDAQNQLLLHESNEFDVTEFVTFLDSYLEYSRLSITEIRRNKTPYYAVTRDGERLVMFYRGLLAAFRPNLQFTVYDDPISDRVRESGVYLKSYDKWQELLYEGVQIVDLGSAKEAPAALTAHIVRHGCQERAFTQSITAPRPE